MNFEAIQPVLDWMQAHPALAGLMVFAIACSESLVIVGIVVPGVALMLGIGTLVGLGVLDLWSVLAWAALGAVFGDGISYWVGRHYDKQLRALWPFTRHPELLPRGERFFKKHGPLSIIIGRFVGPIRPVIPAVAGLMHMNPWVFTTVNIVSAIAWAPVVILPGVAVGASLHLASELAGRLMIVFLLVLLLLWGLFLLLRLVDKTIISPYLKSRSRLARIDYRHMPGLLLNYVLESTMGVFIVTLLAGSLLAHYSEPLHTMRISNMEQQTWWNGGWRTLLDYRGGSSGKTDSQALFRIQWWASEEEMDRLLQQQQWKRVQAISVRNALLWLSPSLPIAELPQPSWTFPGREQSSIYVLADESSGSIAVLRVWSTLQEHRPSDAQLWLGAMSQLNVQEYWGFRIPLPKSEPGRFIVDEAKVRIKRESIQHQGRDLAVYLIMQTSNASD